MLLIILRPISITEFPLKKVLTTLRHTEDTNWPNILKELNDEGQDDLIIGLKSKEREPKLVGRFFALMSWRFHEYFVIREYLIKLLYSLF